MVSRKSTKVQPSFRPCSNWITKQASRSVFTCFYSLCVRKGADLLSFVAKASAARIVREIPSSKKMQRNRSLSCAMPRVANFGVCLVSSKSRGITVLCLPINL